MLPSSIVRYTTHEITGTGTLGHKASFSVDMSYHAIHFASSVSLGPPSFNKLAVGSVVAHITVCLVDDAASRNLHACSYFRT